MFLYFLSRLGESGHVSSPASQSESTCGSPGEQGGGSGGGGHNGHPPEGQPAIQQQQGGLVGTGPSSGSLVSRTMTSSTPTYSSSPASWTLPTPSDNSLGNRDDVKCNCIQNIIFFFFPPLTPPIKTGGRQFFFFPPVLLSSRLVNHVLLRWFLG